MCWSHTLLYGSIAGRRGYHWHIEARQGRSGDFLMVTSLYLQRIVIHAENVIACCDIYAVSYADIMPAIMTAVVQMCAWLHATRARRAHWHLIHMFAGAYTMGCLRLGPMT